ncbi:MAG: PQQ-dependent sugar dehydrogenase [Vicinamibacterales bacterium]|jgi:hypothetical protein|nr:hypothetical protein [Acidobacteriota bacterium]MDP6371616.1 PQQ-dependent sugar dehydrogenase [Vicinamibacterales bacterium]MDP6610399.1 PQQ-dependent sugar dehydrogenase [Vicinamibacterales bacterium]HAK56321.1 hypothetical protein [Acidobacteriota bacterium]|tara:strand:- start:1256 stop:2659 length:1404 start_codon:yes stop_codon:yes gene_type:complete
MVRSCVCVIPAILVAAAATAQTTDDPFATPIGAGRPAIEVNVVEFATLPGSSDEPARPMLLVDEPGTGRLFVNDMRGALYSVSYDGERVNRYLDHEAASWAVGVHGGRGERGFQSFAFHPQFAEAGTPGFGKLYTYVDVADTAPTADFVSGGGNDAHDTLLLEWTAENPGAATYDGGPPRELLRVEQPFGNHNGGQIGFNPVAGPGDADFGLLYVGSADGGSGGDPMDLSQNLESIFGKILRIDPLGSDSANGQYGIPADNPFTGSEAALGEIYAYGLRNPQRFAWDPVNGNMFVADIGQNIVEEVSQVTSGGNLGWNDWEGSYRFISRQEVSSENPRGEAGLVYPVVEYGQLDPLLQRSSASTGIEVYRGTAIRQLANLVLFGDNPSGELFAFSADDLPEGGQADILRILLDAGNGPQKLLDLINEKNAMQGREPATRADMRLGRGPDNQIFVLNKQDDTIRLLVP